MSHSPALVVKQRAPQDAADATGTLELPFELRQRSRLRARLDDGREVGLMLDRGSILRGGDRLLSTCGVCIEVVAGPEPVSVVRTDDPLGLARAAYHLGNRHVALQVAARELRYLCDHVLDEMVRGLGLNVEHAELPFEPESGAYAGHEHSHPHEH